MQFSSSLGNAKFVPGQTQVRVPIAFKARESGRMEVLVKAAGAADASGFRTTVDVDYQQ